LYGIAVWGVKKGWEFVGDIQGTFCEKDARSPRSTVTVAAEMKFCIEIR
jgi:hypothetical protein